MLAIEMLPEMALFMNQCLQHVDYSVPRKICRIEGNYEEIVAQIEEIAPALLEPVTTFEATEEINWEPPDQKKILSKGKYSCSQCHINVWGKPDLNIVCGNCMVQLVPAQSGGME